MKQKPDKHTSKRQKPTNSILEKMGFNISGHWAEKDCLKLYLPYLTYESLIDDIHLHGFNLGKQSKLSEIKKALEI